MTKEMFLYKNVKPMILLMKNARTVKDLSEARDMQIEFIIDNPVETEIRSMLQYYSKGLRPRGGRSASERSLLVLTKRVADEAKKIMSTDAKNMFGLDLEFDKVGDIELLAGAMRSRRQIKGGKVHGEA